MDELFFIDLDLLIPLLRLTINMYYLYNSFSFFQRKVVLDKMMKIKKFCFTL